MKTIGQLNLLAVALLYRLASLLVLNTSQAQTPPLALLRRWLRRWLVSVRTPRLWVPRARPWMGARRTKLTCRPTFPPRISDRSFSTITRCVRCYRPTHVCQSIGSQKQGLVINPDTSVDVYFDPTPPAGYEANWAQTVPGKGWNVLFVFTVRYSRGSTRPGNRVNLNW